MRLVHYLLLTVFHLLVFHSWSRGDEPVRFTVVNRMAEAPAFTVVNRVDPGFPIDFSAHGPGVYGPGGYVGPPLHASGEFANATPPEGFRKNGPNGAIVEYRGGVWRVVPPTPSQYAAPGGQPHPFAYGPPVQWHTAGTPAHHAATTPTPRPTFSAGAAPYRAPIYTLAPAAQRRGTTDGCSSWG